MLGKPPPFRLDRRVKRGPLPFIGHVELHEHGRCANIGGDSLTFDHPIVSYDATPASYRDAAVTNLFYWNNVMHDVTTIAA